MSGAHQDWKEREQAKHFIETARALECDEDEAKFVAKARRAAHP
ncbi:MAG TPA: hypothetical protein VMJ31_07555 [Methylocystis sp.]|nr:hypothetical protein [Methylocystis sp.]